MKLFLKNVLLTVMLLLLTACQTLPKETESINIVAGNLHQHHLRLAYSQATFNNGILNIRGGIKPKIAPLHSNPGYLEISIFNAEGVLLKTIPTTYSPQKLHYVRRKLRTGHFSVDVSGINPQSLSITVNYRHPSKEKH
jgi:hypothetical protein